MIGTTTTITFDEKALLDLVTQYLKENGYELKSEPKITIGVKSVGQFNDETYFKNISVEVRKKE